MKILSFFSFKGGVGRTALLVNLASYWASQGRVVVVVDMDLAAPGVSYSPLVDLQHPLNPQIPPAYGFHELLAALYLGRDPKDRESFSFLPPSGLLRRMRPRDDGSWPKGGALLVLPAGEMSFQTKAWIERGLTRPISPREGRGEAEETEDLILRAFAKLFREDLESFRWEEESGSSRPVDLVLIDCRTGMPELLDLSLGYLADQMVLVAGINQQNREGLRVTLDSLRKERIPFGRYFDLLTVVFSPLPNHIYDDPETLKALEQSEAILKEHRRPPPRPEDQPELLPRIFHLPYTPRLARSDLPLYPGDLRHPYIRSLIDIADQLLPEEASREELLPADNRLVREGEGGKGDEAADRRSSPDTTEVAALMQLPRWYWPWLGRERDPAQAGWQRIATLSGLKEQPEWLDDFLDALAFANGMERGEKEGVLTSLSTWSKSQRQVLLAAINEERQRVAGIGGDGRGLLQRMFATQQTWATLLLGDSAEGEKQFLLQPLNGIVLFPTWEERPWYWFLLAKSLRLDPVRRLRSIEAMQRLGKAVVDRGARWRLKGVMALLDLAEPQDPEWTATLENMAEGVAGDDPWTLHHVWSRLKQIPRTAAVQTVLERAMASDQVSDWGESLQMARWAVSRYPRLKPQAMALARLAVEERNSGSTVAFDSLGDLLGEDLGEYQAAEEAYRTAIRLNKDRLWPWFGLGNLLRRRLGRYEESEAAYRQSIALAGRRPYSWLGLGDLLADHLGRFAEAEAAYRRAGDLDKESFIPWYRLGSLYQDHFNRCREAMNCYDEGLKRDANHPWLLARRGHLCLEMGLAWQENLVRAWAEFAMSFGPSPLAWQLRLAIELGLNQEKVMDGIALSDHLTIHPEDPNLLLMAVCRAMALGDAWQPLMTPALGAIRSYHHRHWSLKVLHTLAGARPDLCEAVREAAGMVFHLSVEGFKDTPRPPEMLERYRPFVEGQSNGAGDPRFRHLFCAQSPLQ